MNEATSSLTRAACQVTVQRELGRFHLVAHRCHGPLGVLGL